MKITHPLLNKIAQDTISRTPKQLREPLQNAIMAGNEIMFAKETKEMFNKHMEQDLPPTELVGEGAAKLVGILWSDSQGKLPLRVLIPAGIVLVCHGLEYLMDAGVLDDITNNEVNEAVKEYSSSFLQLLGVTPEKLQEMLEKGAAGVPIDDVNPVAEFDKRVPAPDVPMEEEGIIQGAQDE